MPALKDLQVCRTMCMDPSAPWPMRKDSGHVVVIRRLHLPRITMGLDDGDNVYEGTGS